MGAVDLRRMVAFSGVLRLLLVAYGEWQDAHMEVRYTDVDYIVFSDAAALVAAGRSPFDRSTYRYSPLLAFLLVPNSALHRSWGKLLFSAADLLVGSFIDTILKLRGVPINLRLWSVAAWLFNPFTFTIGTRGNCEPLVCAIVLWIIICLMKGKLFQAALWYGLVVHFRIYPIIYSLPFVLVLGKKCIAPNGKPTLGQWSPRRSIVNPSSTTGAVTEKQSVCWDALKRSLTWEMVTGKRSVCWDALKSSLTWEMVTFGLLSGSVFFAWTAIFFYIYGWDFLNEALLYHLTRTDPRHNFSIYFYHVYLHHQYGFSALEKLASFLPQMMVQLAFIVRFAGDLPFCLFMQTVAFVAFNKVVTAQYFVWFFCLLPLILPWSNMKLKWKALICILVWMGSQLHWLLWGYLLEFKGQNVFIQLWLASLFFLAANSYVMLIVIQHHRYSSTFKPLRSPDSTRERKME